MQQPLSTQGLPRQFWLSISLVHLHFYNILNILKDAKEDCKGGRVVGVCKSGEKGRQEVNDET